MRLLVVEDSTKMAALLERGLREAGYAVDVANHADDAVWLAQENAYDAIVLDVMLSGSRPGPDGLEVCRRLRQSGRWSPILMLSARDAVGDRIGGLDAGADDYMTKPFSFDELLARVRALVRRGADERPVILEVDDLVLDPATREVSRGATTIELTAKEFALLEYFMRNAGAALSRQRLIEHVWDFAHDGDSNVVDVHIRNLRAKIDRPFRRTSLETLRGVGYRLRDETLGSVSA